MAQTYSVPGPSGLATTTDFRKDVSGVFVTDTSGNPRPGVFQNNTAALVTSRTDMNVNIAAFQALAVQFGGAIMLANDGTAQLPSPLVSPGAGTNYYVVYVKQNESTSPGTDPNNNRVFGAVVSTSSFATARASGTRMDGSGTGLPTGAVELATVEMPTGKTATNQSGVVITSTVQYTGTTGGPFPFRTPADMDAVTNLPHGTLATVFTKPGHLYMSQVGKWGPLHKLVRQIAGTASGTLTGSTWLNLAAAQTIPAAPFGTDVRYEVRVYALSNATLSNNTYAIRIRIDGTVSAQAQAAGTGGISVDVTSSDVITSPNSTHTVEVQILSVTGTSTVSTGATISNFIITLERADTF